jgi:hypothetical protein
MFGSITRSPEQLQRDVIPLASQGLAFAHVLFEQSSILKPLYLPSQIEAHPRF